MADESMPSVEHRSVEVAGVRLAYLVSGDAGNPPMVLLHALGDRAADWTPVLAALAGPFRVFAPDLRGHGDSDRPGSYSFEELYSDVTGWLDQLGLRDIVLVGHSMGATVAYLIAIRQPDRVRRLIIEDAPPLHPRERPVPERPADFDADFDWNVVPAILTQVNAGDQAMWDGLPAITAPALLIGGGAQSHISQARLAAAAALIPRCDLITIEAGHLVHQARPAEFTDTVLGWLARNG
jgi:pimeloyl-ACP methyl ester carboxylesterase